MLEPTITIKQNQQPGDPCRIARKPHRSSLKIRRFEWSPFPRAIARGPIGFSHWGGQARWGISYSPLGKPNPN